MTSIVNHQVSKSSALMSLIPVCSRVSRALGSFLIIGIERDTHQQDTLLFESPLALSRAA